MAAINLSKYSNQRAVITTEKGDTPPIFIFPEQLAGSVQICSHLQFAFAACLSYTNVPGVVVCFGVTWSEAKRILLSNFKDEEEARSAGVNVDHIEEEPEFKKLQKEFEDYIIDQLTSKKNSFEFLISRHVKIKNKAND